MLIGSIPSILPRTYRQPVVSVPVDNQSHLACLRQDGLLLFGENPRKLTEPQRQARHDELLSIHPNIVNFANAVFPIWSHYHQNPTIVNSGRTGFLVEDPRDSEKLLLVSACHGVSAEELRRGFYGALCHNKSSFYYDNAIREPWTNPDFSASLKSDRGYREMAEQDVLVLEPGYLWLETLQGKLRDETIERKGLKLRDFRQKPLQIFEPVFMIGRSARRRDELGKVTTALVDCVETGKITSITNNVPKWNHSFGKQADYIRTDLKSSPGDSGSPVLDDEGQVVGLCAGAGYLVSAETIRKVLGSLA